MRNYIKYTYCMFSECLLSLLVFGFSWEFYGGKKIDLDASAVFFDNLGQVKEAVFYNNLTAFDGGVVHSGESLDGEGEGFDESISVDIIASVLRFGVDIENFVPN